ncbi:ECF-type sigma factor [Isosphaeraceae bacterium EP7]
MTSSSEASESKSDGLFARAQSGDQDAWKILFEACYPKIRRVVRRRMNSPMIRSLYDSTDFASDVWKSLAAKQDRYEFQHVDDVMKFLAKAARDKVAAEYRRLMAQKRQEEQKIAFFGEDGHAIDAVAIGPTPSQVAVAREAADFLVADQPDDVLEVIKAKRDGCSNDEAAGQVGMNVRKVQRILKTLHETRWLTWGR